MKNKKQILRLVKPIDYSGDGKFTAKNYVPKPESMIIKNIVKNNNKKK